jgi:hypothetical protein
MARPPRLSGSRWRADCVVPRLEVLVNRGKMPLPLFIFDGVSQTPWRLKIGGSGFQPRGVRSAFKPSDALPLNVIYYF